MSAAVLCVRGMLAEPERRPMPRAGSQLAYCCLLNQPSFLKQSTKDTRICMNFVHLCLFIGIENAGES